MDGGNQSANKIYTQIKKITQTETFLILKTGVHATWLQANTT